MNAELKPWVKYLKDTAPEMFKECVDSLEATRQSKDLEAKLLREKIIDLKLELRELWEFFDALSGLIERSTERREK